jgi:hypothetical protein
MSPDRIDELRKVLEELLDDAAEEAAQALFVRIRHEPDKRAQLLGAVDGLPLVKSAIRTALTGAGRF